jgi:hypothetical protein
VTRRHLAVDQVAAVAIALGELRDRVVFIGGAIAPLLQTDPPFPRARATSDVDGVVMTSTYAEVQELHDQLAAAGFRRDLADPRHIHRWISPNGVPFDLVPTGEHLGGTGNPWDALAIETAVETTLDEGITIRHAAAPAFLALKWAAHHDRGRDDPRSSHDLEDLLALAASRPSIIAEVAAAPRQLREHLAKQTRAFLDDPAIDELLFCHLNNAQDPAHTVAGVRAALEKMAGE